MPNRKMMKEFGKAVGKRTGEPNQTSKMIERIAVLEVQVSNQIKDLDNFKVLLYDIRSDVSFIRGKLEKE